MFNMMELGLPTRLVTKYRAENDLSGNALYLYYIELIEMTRECAHNHVKAGAITLSSPIRKPVM